MPSHPNTVSRPTRPSMPTSTDDWRSKHTSTRHQILTEEWEKVASEWVGDRVGSSKQKILGTPDLSANPLAEICRQLSTPGLYGKIPEVRHSTEPDAAAPLIGPEGFLAKAGYWQRMQRIQYFALGLGDMLVRLDVPAHLGRLTVRNVFPQNVYVVVDEDAPDAPVVLWELRLRRWEAQEKWIYVWEQYDLGEIRGDVVIREPSYRIVEAMRDGTSGQDLSNIFLVNARGEPGALVGESYPYRYDDGEVFLPFVVYRSIDSGEFWNFLDRRGAHRGTLNTALYYTYAGHCALAASGNSVIVAGLVPVAAEVDRDEENEGAPIRTITLMPGALMYHEFDGDGQPFVKEIGPGANLESVANFARDYEMKIATRFGLMGSDVTRQHANPTSGAALTISNQQKREVMDQVREIFRAGDLEAIRKSAALVRLAGLATTPETGHTISYHAIPKSAEEKKAERDDLDWQVENDFLSPFEAYQKQHPGASEEDAIAAMVKADTDTRRLAAAQQAAAEAAGLVDEGAAADPDAARSLNELSLAVERLVRAGDLEGVNQIRRSISDVLGSKPLADLTTLGPATPAVPPPNEDG